MKKLSSEEELRLEENLIWVCGSPRSGTTWLAKELLSFNTYFLNEFHLDEHLGITTVGVFDRTFVRRIDRHKNDENYVFSEKFRNVWQYFLRKLILNRISAQVKDQDKKIVIKDPGNVGAYDILSKCLPNSKLIFLVRDGRDIIDSLTDALQINGFISKASNYVPITKENRVEFIKMRAKLWVNLMDVIERAFENHSEENKLMIRYEDLLKKTDENLKKIYQFIEMEISEKELDTIISRYDFKDIPIQMKGPKKFYRSATPGKWKNNFTDKEKNIMNTIMGEKLKKYGYA